MDAEGPNVRPSFTAHPDNTWENQIEAGLYYYSKSIFDFDKLVSLSKLINIETYLTTKN